MLIATDGRNPSLTQYILRGLAFALVMVVLFVVLFLRYTGAFSSTVPVRAELTDVGDGLTDGADVRYNGLIVGSVTGVALAQGTGANGLSLRDVTIDLDPDQAEGIPGNVTARTVPSNLFGVNSVEFVVPEQPSSEHVGAGAAIPADRSLPTIKLQDAQNQLRTLLRAVPPEQLAGVLGTIADALRGGGQVFGLFVGVLDQYFQTINAQFPAGATPGFADFNASVRGLSASAPALLDTLGRSVIPAQTVAEHRDDLTALLAAAQGVTDEVAGLFAANGDAGRHVVADGNVMLGAVTYHEDALPQALEALRKLAARALTIFTGVNGHAALNIGVNFSAYQRYTRQNCPVYDGGPYGQLRGPGCVGPGTGTGPTMSGPLLVHPSPGMRRMTPAGSVTTQADNQTLTTALNRPPRAADTLMLGPLVQAVSASAATGDGSASAATGDGSAIAATGGGR
ncbi:MAG: MCE family protein [Gordonia sp. (in: high G+C Gram-positive bacteria)]